LFVFVPLFLMQNLNSAWRHSFSNGFFCHKVRKLEQGKDFWERYTDVEKNIKF